MRKISLVLLCSFILLGVCGCNKGQKQNSFNDNVEQKENKLQDFTYGTKIVGNIENNVIMSYGNYLVLDNMEILVQNFDKLFSNGTNYKKIDKNIMEFIGYYYDDIKEYDFFPLESHTGYFVKNNKVYYKSQNSTFEITETEINDKEEILSLYNDKYIKTNKAYYYATKYKTNKSECEKYADVECEYSYKIVNDKILTKYYNNIKYITTGGANSDWTDSPTDLTIIVFNDNNIYIYKK